MGRTLLSDKGLFLLRNLQWPATALDRGRQLLRKIFIDYRYRIFQEKRYALLNSTAWWIVVVSRQGRAFIGQKGNGLA